MSESKDKELSLDELKDASGGVVHPEFRKAVVHPEFQDGDATGLAMGKQPSTASKSMAWSSRDNQTSHPAMNHESIGPDSKDAPPLR